MSELIDRPAAVPSRKTRPFLSVDDLHVTFNTEDGKVHAVDGLSFDLERGETLAIVGESGSGKSVTSQAILGLHKGRNADITGEIWLDGNELVAMPDTEMRRLRGSKVAMIFQDPLSSLHPYYRVGDQIVEAYRVHHKVSKEQAKARAVEMLELVGIPNPARRFRDYPHQFSGGMRQRAMIAMALVCDPDLLIADEPTTALDVTVQAQILELMKRLQTELNSALIIITHDLGVVAETADNVVVMYGGRCVERGTVLDVFYQPEMPYTWGLLSSMPRLDRVRKERLEPIKGNPPSLIHIPTGCVFHPRCDYRHIPGEVCVTDRPDLLPVVPGNEHHVRCHIAHQQRVALWEQDVRTEL